MAGPERLSGERSGRRMRKAVVTPPFGPFAPREAAMGGARPSWGTGGEGGTMKQWVQMVILFWKVNIII